MLRAVGELEPFLVLCLWGPVCTRHCEFAGDTQTLLMWTMEGHMWGQRRGRSNFRSMMPTLASQSGPSVSITLMAVQTGLSLPGPRCIRHWRWEIRRTRKQTPSLLFPNLEEHRAPGHRSQTWRGVPRTGSSASRLGVCSACVQPRPDWARVA